MDAAWCERAERVPLATRRLAVLLAREVTGRAWITECGDHWHILTADPLTTPPTEVDNSARVQ